MGHISGTWELLLCEYWRKSMNNNNLLVKRLTRTTKTSLFDRNWAISLKPRWRSRPLCLVWWALLSNIIEMYWFIDAIVTTTFCHEFVRNISAKISCNPFCFYLMILNWHCIDTIENLKITCIRFIPCSVKPSSSLAQYLFIVEGRVIIQCLWWWKHCS